MKDYFKLYTGLQQFCLDRGIVPMISARPVNPFMVEGTKTISFEVTSTLGTIPDDIFCCVGGGGLLGGVYKGFDELMSLGKTKSNRKSTAASASTSDSANRPDDRGALPLRRLLSSARRRMGVEINQGDEWFAPRARRRGDHPRAGKTRSRGGIFAEPQGAYAAAALIRAANDKTIDPDATVVCVITGIGLKDMGAASRFGEHVPHVPPIRSRKPERCAALRRKQEAESKSTTRSRGETMSMLKTATIGSLFTLLSTGAALAATALPGARRPRSGSLDHQRLDDGSNSLDDECQPSDRHPFVRVASIDGLELSGHSATRAGLEAQ